MPLHVVPRDRVTCSLVLINCALKIFDERVKAEGVDKKFSRTFARDDRDHAITVRRNQRNRLSCNFCKFLISILQIQFNDSCDESCEIVNDKAAQSFKVRGTFLPR